jgi:myo-inositol-1(or 4)-monophosphatase
MEIILRGHHGLFCYDVAMKDYLELAKQLATQAGQIMQENFVLGMDKEWKSDNTPLTIADTSINELVINEVKKNFPGHGVLGEEASFNQESEFVWVVDPVDGTMPFSHGIPTSTFSLALVQNGQPIVAAVQDPFSNRQYTAIKGEGAFLNGERLHVNSQGALELKVFIDVSARPKFQGFDAGKLLSSLMEKGVYATKSLSAVYFALPVVTGQHAASICLLEFPWDGAAIALLVEEAGGKVTDLNGQQRQWNEFGDGFVVSNGLVHEALLKELQVSKE